MKAIALCQTFALLCTFGVAQSSNVSNSNHASWVLRFDGIGPVKVGMTLEQVNDVFQSETVKPVTVTAAGIRVGDSELRVKRVYGDGVAVEAHHYDPEGHYLYLRSGKYELRFETDGKKVTSFYAGTMEAVAFVEGCS